MQSSPGYGLFCYRIHGLIHHRVGSLHPASDNDAEMYAQLCIIDASHAPDARIRMPEKEQCRSHVMHTVQSAVDSLSPYAAAYKHMAEVARKDKDHATTAGAPEGEDAVPSGGQILAVITCHRTMKLLLSL